MLSVLDVRHVQASAREGRATPRSHASVLGFGVGFWRRFPARGRRRGRRRGCRHWGTWSDVRLSRGSSGARLVGDSGIPQRRRARQQTSSSTNREFLRHPRIFTVDRNPPRLVAAGRDSWLACCAGLSRSAACPSRSCAIHRQQHCGRGVARSRNRAARSPRIFSRPPERPGAGRAGCRCADRCADLGGSRPDNLAYARRTASGGRCSPSSHTLITMPGTRRSGTHSRRRWAGRRGRRQATPVVPSHEEWRWSSSPPLMAALDAGDVGLAEADR